VPDSPCTGVCRLDDDGVCAGCARTGEQIRRWRELSPAQRRAVVAAADPRTVDLDAVEE
jgi:predicted Fe-S protein YdhL (DUF1289 family)